MATVAVRRGGRRGDGRGSAFGAEVLVLHIIPLGTVAGADVVESDEEAQAILRVLKGAELKPHRCEYWKRKTDPQFDAKMRPIVELYLNPPNDGPVWCFDEMTCIQALERCFRELPLRRPGELAKRSFEYVRHGTRCLLAALEVHTGRILGQVYPRRRREEFIAFLDRLDAEVPAGQAIHLVLDNLNIHRGPHVDEWLTRHPAGRVAFHFLPFHASWLNQVEIWFNTLQRRCLRRGDFHSAATMSKSGTAPPESRSGRAAPA